MAGPTSVSTAGSAAAPRIPMALQQVFMASQGGDDVEEIVAPKGNIGFRVFKRAWGVGRRIKKAKPMKAPSKSSLASDRSNGDNSTETAADATRKAMQKNVAVEEEKKEEESAQAFLDKLLESRGYSTKKHCSLEGGYYCRPTPLQQASYGSCISQAIRASDATLLRRLMDAGISPNPCNNFGESLVHMVCRRGDHKLLRVLLEAGCSLQVTDDYGRTPLHDACWRADPSFELVQMILDSDKHLLNLLDCRGAAPLSYIKPKIFALWIKFLQTKVERFWPVRNIGTEGEERPPPLTLRQPHSLPIPDPSHALPLEVCAMVANGRMQPEEALYLDDSSSDEDDTDSFDSDDDDDDSGDSDDDSDSESSDSDEESDFDEEEMAEFCLRAGGPLAIAQKCFGGAGGKLQLAEKTA